MSESTEGLTRLVRRCVMEGRGGPWAELLSKVDQVVRAGFLSGSGTPSDLAEFLDWFPGWLFDKRKLQALVRSLRAKQENGECPDADSRDAFATNYFARIVATAKADFYRERQPRERPVDPQAFSGLSETGAGPNDAIKIALAEVERALASLPPEIRVPFRLKYYASIGPLSEEERQWVSERSGESGEVVARLIDEEFNKSRHRTFPLSSEFIGELLAIPPSLSGKNMTVDQRVARARKRLSESAGDEA